MPSLLLRGIKPSCGSAITPSNSNFSCFASTEPDMNTAYDAHTTYPYGVAFDNEFFMNTVPQDYGYDPTLGYDSQSSETEWTGILLPSVLNFDPSIAQQYHDHSDSQSTPFPLHHGMALMPDFSMVVVTDSARDATSFVSTDTFTGFLPLPPLVVPTLPVTMDLFPQPTQPSASPVASTPSDSLPSASSSTTKSPLVRASKSRRGARRNSQDNPITNAQYKAFLKRKYECYGRREFCPVCRNLYAKGSVPRHLRTHLPDEEQDSTFRSKVWCNKCQKPLARGDSHKRHLKTCIAAPN